MAEPLKDSFGLDVIERLATMIAAVHPEFPTAHFVAAANAGFLDLELTPRAHHITQALAAHLPAYPVAALQILGESLGPPLGLDESDGMASFKYLPFVFYVAEHGLDSFEESMRFQYEVTRRFTAEFSIRAFLEHHPERTLNRLREWATDPDMHVRRLVSEGTRPRLPWAPRLARFQEDPTPVISLLEMLKDDPTEYVRRSVANNLNDIAKDHPDLVAELCARWMDEDPQRRPLVRHALRTLVKQGHTRALAALGFGAGTPASIDAVAVEPATAAIGSRIAIRTTVTNPTPSTCRVVVDFRVHFVKADGTTRPKVFKGAELDLGPGQTTTVRKTISLAQHTTRRHYPGRHGVEVLMNGVAHPAPDFVVLAESG
jgi:3-methyladenine DNA glycosylase AlkC